MPKSFVCRCEDVTVDDIAATVAHGYCDIEEVKRYTGFGTGLCQGKECLALVAQTLVQLQAHADAKMPQPFTVRAPLTPTALHVLAQDPSAHRLPDDDGAVASTELSTGLPRPALKPILDTPK